MGSFEGRLELTWTNKPLRLLAQEDGSYEWVRPPTIASRRSASGQT